MSNLATANDGQSSIPNQVKQLIQWDELLAAVDRNPKVDSPSKIAGFHKDAIGSASGAHLSRPAVATAASPAAADTRAVASPPSIPGLPGAPPLGGPVPVGEPAPGLPVVASESDEDEAEKERRQRKAIDELGKLLSKSTKSTAEQSWFTSRDPMTDRSQIRWARVAPLIIVGVFVFYGALRLYASPASASDTGIEAAASERDAKKADGEGTLPEESLFAPRSKYEVTGLKEGEEAPPEKPDEEPERPAPAPSGGTVAKSDAPRPAPPAAWQASLLMDMPAREEYVDEAMPPPSGLGITLREGTRIPATLVGTLASSYESPVQARLDEDFMEAGLTVLPRGTILLGRTQANVTQKRVYVKFHRAVLPSGAAIELSAAAQNADLSTGLVADRVEKHRSRNIVAGTIANVAGTAGRIVGIGGGEAAYASQAASQQIAGEARSSIEPKATLYVNAGRRIFVYLEADLDL